MPKIETRIFVLVFEPGQAPYSKSIPSELEYLQSIVGGLIEVFPLGLEGVIGVCNEEGLNCGLEWNRYIPAVQTVILGTFFVAADVITRDGKEFGSLTDEQIAAVHSRLPDVSKYFETLATN